MKIGIIGSGDVGKSLARGFLSRGHEVMIGSREPAKLLEFVHETGDAARSGNLAQTAEFGELIVIATLFSGTKAALDLAGPKNFAGKVVIDATNPLKFEEGKLPALSLGFSDSAGESVQRWLAEAKVVKAFNTVGHAHMVDPAFPDGPPTMFIAGNDADAKRMVSGLCDAFGWAVIDVGGIEGSRLLEPLCILWVNYGIMNQSWNHAFKMLRH